MSWIDIQRPLISLSPMADFTDSPFCRLIRECGGKAIIFREMLAAEALVRGNARTLKALEFNDKERPIVQQLFGSDPVSMSAAASLVESLVKPDGIDINMGCPVYKAVSNFNGASLMREPDKAAEIVRAVKGAIRVPLSVKTRLGWSRPQEAIEFVKRLEDAGADAIEIHARTKEQGYSGKADWTAVADVVDSVKIPILVNGDIIDPTSAKESLNKSGAQGFLVGRGALGNPWIFKRMQAVMNGETDPGEPTLEVRLAGLRRHAELQIEHYGEKSLIKLRKHFPWYFKSIPNFRQYRAEAVKVSTMDELDALIAFILTSAHRSELLRAKNPLDQQEFRPDGLQNVNADR